jgi:alanine racemase
VPLRAVARVNLAAIERNVARLRAGLAPGARLCAVVKADGYGHGAVPVARAALAGGAESLAVATAAEAQELRAAGVDGPLLVMGALWGDDVDLALDAGAEIVAWRESFVTAVQARGRPARLHVKLDTGMGRLGTRDPDEATRVAEAVGASGTLTLAGAMTHFATADERADGFFAEQLARFTAWADPLRAAHPGIVLHAANSAATLRDSACHLDLVRAGIAIYGLDPFGRDPGEHRLEPALEVRSYVAEIKSCARGESAGYGRRFLADRDTVVATLPIGYGDGVRRGLSNNADVLVRGRRRPLVGTVSMDNVTLDLGAEGGGAERGDEAVLIGAQGDERILAEEIARRLDTITYEVTCGISARVPREYHRDGDPP